MPVGPLQVLVFEESHHWTNLEKSVVATRGADGVWRIDAVQEVNVGSDGLERQAPSTRELSAEQGARLDGLLADTCLRAEPVNTSYSSVETSTETRWTLEVSGASSPVIIAGGHAGFGRSGAIVTLLAGSL